MSVRTGFPIQRMKIGGTATNPTGAYVGNNTIVTYINKGTYIVNINIGILPIFSSTITNAQFAVTINYPYGNGLETILCAVNPTGQQGLTANSEVRMTGSNIYKCNQDRTPIYVYITCDSATGWSMGSQQFDQQLLNYLSFTKIGY